MRHLTLVSLVGLLICADWAHAEPIAGLPFSTPASIVCDDRSQIQELFEASRRDNGTGVVEVYNKWHGVIDARQEPTCNLQPLIRAMIKSVEDKGMTRTPDAQNVHAWFVELGGADGATGWALYGEVLQGDAPNSESALHSSPQGLPI